jgi:hypothetical protein
MDRRAFQTKTSAMKHKTALNPIMKAINSFFVGCRHNSFCGSRDRQQGVEQQSKPRNIFDAIHQFSPVTRGNLLSGL